MVPRLQVDIRSAEFYGVCERRYQLKLALTGVCAKTRWGRGVHNVSPRHRRKTAPTQGELYQRGAGRSSADEASSEWHGASSLRRSSLSWSMMMLAPA